MKILFLYTEFMSYYYPVLRLLSKKGFRLFIVYKDIGRNTPFEKKKYKNFIFIKRSTLKLKSIKYLVKHIDPDLVYVSGWSDKLYLILSLVFKFYQKKVVVGFDDQWHGSFKQNIAFLLGKLNFFKNFYSHAWVSGTLQYEYARNLGFKKNEIIFDLLTCDNIFKLNPSVKKRILKNRVSKKFVYVGRLSPEKGVKTLISAWCKFSQKYKNCKLVIVGSTDKYDKNLIIGVKNVSLKPFMNSSQLKKELENSICGILPSNKEQWGVVLHEYCSSSLPIISSDKVGSNKTFLINDYNGYEFKSESVNSLVLSLEKIYKLSEKKLGYFISNSYKISFRITDQTSLSNLLSIL